MFNLTGKRVVITGGGGGMGTIIARRFHASGAVVIVADLNENAARNVAAEWGAPDDGFMVDVTSEASVVAFFRRAADRLGGLDAIVHCPGITVGKPFVDQTLEDWRRVIAINLRGTFLCCREAARIMCSAGGGSIVTIASSAAHRASVNICSYSASKAAVANLTRGIALELAQFGVRANAISPGPTDTEFVTRNHSAARRAEFNAHVPMGRYGRPEEMAAAAAFLCSDAARSITAEVLHVDGGLVPAGLLK